MANSTSGAAWEEKFSRAVAVIIIFFMKHHEDS
jgi:hypothetical protein